jgi:hypothetical protein
MDDHSRVLQISNPESHSEGHALWSLFEGILPFLIVLYDLFHGSFSFSGGSKRKKSNSQNAPAIRRFPAK